MDFYTALAAEVLKKPYNKVTPAERERARKYWYTRLYNDVSLQYFVGICAVYTDITYYVSKHTKTLDIDIPAPSKREKYITYQFDSAEAAFEFLSALTTVDYPPHDIHIICYSAQELPL